MQNTHGTLDDNGQPKISQSDKLLFCLFLACAVHGMLFFGIGFSVPKINSGQSQKTFNVVLAQFEAENKPEKADFIGQANQEGGGESEQLLAPSVREKALFNDPNQVSSELAMKQSMPNSTLPKEEVITGDGKLTTSIESKKTTPDEAFVPDAAELIDKSYQLAGLIANLDDKTVNQARKGRKRAVSASIHRASDALYLDSWRRKIERIGNLNYPQKARVNKMYGNLTMKVAINKNGTINNVVITKSSGISELDRAALKIVRLAAPFNPLTKEMAKDTDILEIVRVWRFQPDYRLKTQ